MSVTADYAEKLGIAIAKNLYMRNMETINVQMMDCCIGMQIAIQPVL